MERSGHQEPYLGQSWLVLPKTLSSTQVSLKKYFLEGAILILLKSLFLFRGKPCVRPNLTASCEEPARAAQDVLNMLFLRRSHQEKHVVPKRTDRDKYGQTATDPCSEQAISNFTPFNLHERPQKGCPFCLNLAKGTSVKYESCRSLNSPTCMSIKDI